jgi:hypothetical protein
MILRVAEALRDHALSRYGRVSGLLTALPQD